MAATGGLLACHPRASWDPEPPAFAPTSDRPTLEEIADLIDPGPQTPLSDGLPPRIFELLGLEENPAASGTALLKRSVAERELIARTVDESEAPEVLISLIRASARAVVLAEQAAQRGAVEADALAQLERVYQAVDVPALANDRNVIVQFISAFAANTAADGASDSAELQQLVQRAQAAMRAAGPLHRRTVALLLRTAPDHPAVPTALLAVAKAELGADHEWTISTAKLALERRGTLASAAEHLDLARVCLAGLDVPCAEAALRAAAGAEDIDDVARDVALARRIVELADASTLETRLERARALLELERYATARAELEALHAEFPKDARPVIGLALHAVEKDLDFRAANRLIEAQDAPTNTDAEYYELAIGTRMMVVLETVLPRLATGDEANPTDVLKPVVRRMRADVDGYAALGNSDGRFLAFVLDVGEELLAEFEKTGTIDLRYFSSLSDRVVALQAKIPDNPHAYRLLMSAALFEPEKSRAATMAGVRAPMGPERDVLILRRARALCDLAVTWSDPDLAKQAREALREVDPASSPEAAELHADALLVQRQLGGSATWETIGNTYLSLIGDDVTSEDARALNNAAYAALNDDGLAGAQEAWKLSSQLSEDHGDVGKLNLIVAATPDGDAAARAAMRALASETKNASVRASARAWVLAWSTGKARRDAQAALQTALDRATKQSPRPTAPDPYSGLLLEGTFKTGLGYATEPGLEINFDSSGLPWAILAPPR